MDCGIGGVAVQLDRDCRSGMAGSWIAVESCDWPAPAFTVVPALFSAIVVNPGVILNRDTILRQPVNETAEGPALVLYTPAVTFTDCVWNCVWIEDCVRICKIVYKFCDEVLVCEMIVELHVNCPRSGWIAGVRCCRELDRDCRSRIGGTGSDSVIGLQCLDRCLCFWPL